MCKFQLVLDFLGDVFKIRCKLAVVCLWASNCLAWLYYICNCCILIITQYSCQQFAVYIFNRTVCLSFPGSFRLGLNLGLRCTAPQTLQLWAGGWHKFTKNPSSLLLAMWFVYTIKILWEVIFWGLLIGFCFIKVALLVFVEMACSSRVFLIHPFRKSYFLKGKK